MKSILLIYVLFIILPLIFSGCDLDKQGTGDNTDPNDKYKLLLNPDFIALIDNGDSLIESNVKDFFQKTADRALNNDDSIYEDIFQAMLDFSLYPENYNGIDTFSERAGDTFYSSTCLDHLLYSINEVYGGIFEESKRTRQKEYQNIGILQDKINNIIASSYKNRFDFETSFDIYGFNIDISRQFPEFAFSSLLTGPLSAFTGGCPIFDIIGGMTGLFGEQGEDNIDEELLNEIADQLGAIAEDIEDIKNKINELLTEVRKGFKVVNQKLDLALLKLEDIQNELSIINAKINDLGQIVYQNEMLQIKNEMIAFYSDFEADSNMSLNRIKEYLDTNSTHISNFIDFSRGLQEWYYTTEGDTLPQRIPVSSINPAETKFYARIIKNDNSEIIYPFDFVNPRIDPNVNLISTGNLEYLIKLINWRFHLISLYYSDPEEKIKQTRNAAIAIKSILEEKGLFDDMQTAYNSLNEEYSLHLQNILSDFGGSNNDIKQINYYMDGKHAGSRYLHITEDTLESVSISELLIRMEIVKEDSIFDYLGFLILNLLKLKSTVWI